MFIQRDPHKNYYIYFAMFAVNLTTFATGGCFSWTSPVIPKFKSSDPSRNPLSTPISTFEAAWLVSILAIGLLCGPPVSGPCTEKLGKKKTLLILSVPILLAHVLCLFATNINIFLVARLLMGLGTGCVWSVLPTYVSELSEDRNRGMMGCLIGVMGSSGSLFAYLAGPFLSMAWFSVVNLCPLILFYILFGFFVPESPYDLLIKNNHKDAEESLMKLRRLVSSQVQNELSYIMKSIEASKSGSQSYFDLFRVRGLYRALTITVALMFFQQLSGIFAVISYAQTIFELAGSSIPPAFSAIIVGTVSLISTIVTCPLIDRMGRKVLLTSSCIVAFFSLSTLGIYFHFLEQQRNVAHMSWLPIACLMVYMFAYNFGLSVLPWVVLGEVFPSNVKSMASSITALSNFSLSFCISMSFPYLIEGLGMAATFLIFGGVMVLGTVFCLVVLPETKGKSFQEIQKMLND